MEELKKPTPEVRFEEDRNNTIERLEKKLKEIEDLPDDMIVQLWQTPWLGIDDLENNPAKTNEILVKELKDALIKEIDLAKNAKENKDLDNLEEYDGLLDYYAIKITE